MKEIQVYPVGLLPIGSYNSKYTQLGASGSASCSTAVRGVGGIEGVGGKGRQMEDGGGFRLRLGVTIFNRPNDCACATPPPCKRILFV